MLEDCSRKDAELDLVQPGRMRGCVMEVHLWLAGQPVQGQVEFGVDVLGNDSVHEIQLLPAPFAVIMATRTRPLWTPRAAKRVAVAWRLYSWVETVRALIRHIEPYIDQWNVHPTPFVWTKNPADIIKKAVLRGR